MMQTYPEIAGCSGLVRKAKERDLPGIVSIHQKACSHFFLTRMGSDFLRNYYGLVLRYNKGIILVSERAGTLEGFACGFVDPAAFYKTMWRARWSFVRPVLFALLRRPLLVTKVLDGVHRIQTPASAWPAGSCELSSIAVTPEAGGKGVGKFLMHAFLHQAHLLSAHCVYLTTDADGNDAVNAFYRDVGFQHTRRFLQRKGRWMNEYVINGAQEENRCEP
jgi:ribosomal protein S18 acetylase RimI-like enzyme